VIIQFSPEIHILMTFLGNCHVSCLQSKAIWHSEHSVSNFLQIWQYNLFRRYPTFTNNLNNCYFSWLLIEIIESLSYLLNGKWTKNQIKLSKNIIIGKNKENVHKKISYHYYCNDILILKSNPTRKSDLNLMKVNQ
jgi:hypothetical protein